MHIVRATVRDDDGRERACWRVYDGGEVVASYERLADAVVHLTADGRAE